MVTLNIEWLLVSAEKQNKAEDKRNEKSNLMLVRELLLFVLYYNGNFDIKVNPGKSGRRKTGECENKVDVLTLTVVSESGCGGVCE